MKYRSKKGTVINIPDGLTPRQIESIKADADAGYGTRAQETANRLGKTTTPGGVATGGAEPAAKPTPDLQAQIARTQAEIDKRGGPDEAPGYATRLQELRGALNGSGGTPPDLQAQIARTQAEIDKRGGPDEAPGYAARLEQLKATAGAPGVPPDVTVDGPRVTQPPPDQDDTLGPDGNIDQNASFARLEALRKIDEEKQFRRDNPDETDEYGNTVSYYKDANGIIQRKITQGETAKTFTRLATQAADSFNRENDRKAAEDATYGTLTKYYDRDRSRELEEQKQELAERGIPYDPAAAQDVNSKNLYGRTIGGIDQKYTGMKDDASRQAILAGNQAYATTSSARDSFLTAVTNGANTFGSNFKQFVNTVNSHLGDDSLGILSMSVEQLAQNRGISLQEAESVRNDALSLKTLKEQTRSNKAGERIATKIANKPTGGGGGGGSSDSAGGFELLG